VIENILDKPMSYAERQQLGHNIHYLKKEHLLGIVDIMRDSNSDSNEVLEFDLKALPNRKCRELEVFVNQCIKES
jgi:hypothetical protein